MNIPNFKIELEKALLSNNASKKIDILRNTEDGKIILKDLNNLENLEQNKYHKYDVLNHTYLVIDNSPKKLVIRYAALFHDIGKFKTKTNVGGKIQFLGHEDESELLTDIILTNLGYTSSFINKVKELVLNHMLLKYTGDNANITNKQLFKFKNNHSKYLNDLLDLIHSDNISHGTIYDMPNQIPLVKDKLKNLNYTPQVKKDLPLNGNDIIKLFNVTGKEVGIYLNKLEDYYLLNPKLSKTDYINYLKNINIYENRFILEFNKFIK